MRILLTGPEKEFFLDKLLQCSNFVQMKRGQINASARFKELVFGYDVLVLDSDSNSLNGCDRIIYCDNVMRQRQLINYILINNDNNTYSFWSAWGSTAKFKLRIVTELDKLMARV